MRVVSLLIRFVQKLSTSAQASKVVQAPVGKMWVRQGNPNQEAGRVLVADTRKEGDGRVSEFRQKGEGNMTMAKANKGRRTALG